MKRIGFRARLFLILLLFAVIPAVVLTLVWTGFIARGLPLVSGSAAWDSVAASGSRAIAAAREHPLTAAQEAAITAHEQELAVSVIQARRLQYFAQQGNRALALLALLLSVLLALLASWLAGHLSRQLGRPIGELVEWADRIAAGEQLPEGPPRRGAPEFEVLRQRMRTMSAAIEHGRAQERETERLEAFRETARRVAHELKNPLTPIRFAVERLRREAPPQLSETVEVLAVESQRLEKMARSFAQFGRLPEGPPSDIDVAELVRYTARATVPTHLPVSVNVEDGLPMVRGHYDALGRALSNILLNAVEACRNGGELRVRVGGVAAADDARGSVEVVVEDTGCGIPPDQLERIWEPYVTTRAGGTGLGLAIAKQTVLAHAGSVEAHSEEGRGTRIRFVLPAEAATDRSEPRHD